MEKEQTKKSVKGYGVVGTWANPIKGELKLGGTLPQWLSDSRTNAKGEANGNQRLFKFLEDTEQWLCEITIKPIRRLKPKKQFTE